MRAASLLLACESATEFQIHHELTAVPQGIELSVAVEPAEVIAGDTVRIEVTVANRRGRPVTLHFPSTCQLVPLVEDAAGEKVSPFGGCGAMFTDLRLGPQQEKRIEDRWATVRYRPASRPPAWDPLPPETYRVFGLLGAQPSLRSEGKDLVILRRPD